MLFRFELLELRYQTTLNSASINTLPATWVTLASSDRNTQFVRFCTDSLTQQLIKKTKTSSNITLIEGFWVFLYVWTHTGQIISCMLSLIESRQAHTLNILRMLSSGLKERFQNRVFFSFSFSSSTVEKDKSFCPTWRRVSKSKSSFLVGN